MKSYLVKAVAACLLLSLAGTAAADPAYWTDWTSATEGDVDTVIGTITAPGLGNIGVTYAGNYAVANVDGTGTNYWSPESTYADGDIVNNGPALADIIGLESGGLQTHTVTFSQPVVNPLLAVVSLGQEGYPVTYNFDASFDIVALGPGHFGTGPLAELPGKILEGHEGHGTIQFQGTFTAIHWTARVPEDLQGFTVGIPGVGGPSVVPAPGAVLLAAIGTSVVGYLRRRGAL